MVPKVLFSQTSLRVKMKINQRLVDETFNVRMGNCGLYNDQNDVNRIKDVLKTRDRAEKTYFEEVENEIEEKSNYLNDQVKRFDDLLEKRDKLIEYKALLKKTKEVLGNSVIFV